MRGAKSGLHTNNYHRKRSHGIPRAICFAFLEIITGCPVGGC
jgi:hypothetical protein